MKPSKRLPQFDLNGKEINRSTDLLSLGTQKNLDGTTTIWRNKVMYLIPSGDPVNEEALKARSVRILKADLKIRKLHDLN